MDKAVEKYQQRRDARVKKRLDEFREGDHPRDENGRFASGGGGGKSGGKSGALSAGKRKEAKGLIERIAKNKPVGGFTSGKLSKELQGDIDKLLDMMHGSSSEEQAEINNMLKKHGLK